MAVAEARAKAFTSNMPISGNEYFRLITRAAWEYWRSINHRSLHNHSAMTTEHDQHAGLTGKIACGLASRAGGKA